MVETIEVRHAQVQLVAGQLFEDLLGAQGAEFEAQFRVLLVHAPQQRQRIEARQWHHAQAQGADQMTTAGGRFGIQAVVGGDH
ncbi:hypothetical protein D3C79_931700 [compost metagenome]